MRVNRNLHWVFSFLLEISRHEDRIKTMRKFLPAGWSIFVLLSALLISCAGTGAREPMTLDGLHGGMMMESVICLLGCPTTLIELQNARQSEVYYDLTYVNTIITPGVVELYFRPGLSEIRLNTEIYKDFSDEGSSRSD